MSSFTLLSNAVDRAWSSALVVFHRARIGCGRKTIVTHQALLGTTFGRRRGVPAGNQAKLKRVTNNSGDREGYAGVGG